MLTPEEAIQGEFQACWLAGRWNFGVEKTFPWLGGGNQNRHGFSVNSPPITFYFPTWVGFRLCSSRCPQIVWGQVSYWCFLYSYFYCSFTWAISVWRINSMSTSIPSFEEIFYLCFAWEGKLSSWSCLCVSLPFTLHYSQHGSNSRFRKCQTYFAKGSA